MNVRPATGADRDPIGRVRATAIRELAASTYDERQLAAWATEWGSEPDPIDDPHRYVVVAEPPRGGLDPNAADRLGDGPGEGDAIAATAEDETVAATARDGATDGVVGVGQLNVDTAEIEAVYVAPDHVSRGVGSTLLSHLEDAARGNGIPSLELLASLNAVPFYRAAGYETVEPETHEATDGIELACVWMRKSLVDGDW